MMRIFTRAGLWAVAFLLTTNLCQADLAPPPGGRPRPRPRPAGPIAPQAEKGVPIVVKVDANATTARLQIPRKLLPKGQLSQVDAPGTSRTVIAGLALSGAMASVVLLRGRSRTVRVATACAVLAAGIFGAVQISMADIALPDDGPNGLADGPRVTIEIVKTGNSITLTLPPGMIPQQAGAAPTATSPQ